MIYTKAFQQAFGLTEPELLWEKLSASRVKELIDRGITGGIEVIDVSFGSNSYGEWLFLTLQGLNSDSEHEGTKWLQLTLYGLGYHWAREEWVATFRYYGTTAAQRCPAKVTVLTLWDLWEEAKALVEQGRKTQEQRSRTAKLYARLADSGITDEDGLLADFEDQGLL
ncbi:MAG: hypothetical protein ACE5OZ_04310 [Candidatus Heimdallarchaeota archaeon]